VNVVAELNRTTALLTFNTMMKQLAVAVATTHCKQPHAGRQNVGILSTAVVSAPYRACVLMTKFLTTVLASVYRKLQLPQLLPLCSRLIHVQMCAAVLVFAPLLLVPAVNAVTLIEKAIYLSVYLLI
jgi:hypothetical protein